MTLKDRFLTQSAPDICHKLQKQAFGPNQSLKKKKKTVTGDSVYYGRDYEEENRRKKEPGKKLKPQQWLLDLL